MVIDQSPGADLGEVKLDAEVSLHENVSNHGERNESLYNHGERNGSLYRVRKSLSPR